MIPEGAQPFDAKISQDIKVTFAVPGVYVIACKPHTAMGMVQATQQTSTRSTRAPFPKARTKLDTLLEPLKKN